MCVLGSCKFNFMVHIGYIEEALKFIAKIPINLNLGVYKCILVN